MGIWMCRIEYHEIPNVSRELASKFADQDGKDISDDGSTLVYVCDDFIKGMREVLGGGPRNSELKKLVEENKLRDEFEEWVESIKDEMDFDLMISW